MKGVLFDLDGTLLAIDLRAFLGRYFEALARASEPLLVDGLDGARLMSAIRSATSRMMEPHPGLTNLSVFAREFNALTGLDFERAWPLYDRFYAEVFPTLKADAGPAPGGRAAVEAALASGLRVAIATNPIFPRVAVDHRLAWAGLDDLGIDVVTSYETMTACKPHPEYFSATAALLGLAPAECLMVGDDRYLDLPAADTGMRTYYVGGSADAATDYRGTLGELADLLPRLVTPADV